MKIKTLKTLLCVIAILLILADNIVGYADIKAIAQYSQNEEKTINVNQEILRADITTESITEQQTFVTDIDVGCKTADIQYETDIEPEAEEEQKPTKEIVVKKDTVKKSNKKYIGKFKIVMYCAKCNGTNGKWNKTTSTGKTAKPNHTIAVDPNVIPYGTHVIINGKEYVAEDCGVHGKCIDIFVSDHSKETSYYAKVYIKES